MPAPVVVIGGGVAGLGTALGLSRAGQPVVIVDRDDLSVAANPDEAFRLERRGAPQVRHTHGLLARLTGLLAERFPDVLDTLVAAGGVEVDLTRRFGDHREGDAALRVLLARRTTLEWALRRATSAEPRVTLQTGCAVEGLVGGAGVVQGVRLATGKVLDAAAVVVAGGWRAPVPDWLAPLGVEVSEKIHDTGIVYLTRWYRTAEDWDPIIDGDALVQLGGDLGYLFYLAVPADRGTFSITMAIAADDASLRTQLLASSGFERAARALPLPAGLVERLLPDGPVHPMGGLINRIRRFVDADGRPLVEGFHAVGDAHTCTNPIYGRGCALALVHAAALTDAFVAYPGQPLARASAYEGACTAQSEPWYRLSVRTDRARQARYHQEADAALAAVPAPSPMDQLFALGGDDPLLGRAILRAVNLLATPDELMADTALVARAMELAAAGKVAAGNQWARLGPTHKEMLELSGPLTAA